MNWIRQVAGGQPPHCFPSAYLHVLVGFGTNQGVCLLQGPETLESQLSGAQAALTQALCDRDVLLLELKKYDPMFSL